MQLLSVEGVVSATVTHVEGEPGTAEVVCLETVKEEDLTAAVRKGYSATVKNP